MRHSVSRFISLLLTLLLLLSGCSGGETSEPPVSAVPSDFPIETSVITLPDVSTEQTETVVLTDADLHKGDLLLVNRNVYYDASLCAGEVTSVREGRTTQIQEGTYRLPIGKALLSRLETMQADMQSATSADVVFLVNDSYRTMDAQQAVYDDLLEQYGQAYVDRYVAPVGRSEHHTVLAADLSFYDLSSGAVLATTSDGAAPYYAWLLENCRKYGFILRYTTEKEAITGYSAESWHFRYVGVPHADYIAAHSLALEEYLEQLKSTSFESRLTIQTDRGERYSVYYVPASSGETAVRVPKGDYTVSGNNVDGFIVTVREPGA